VTDDLPARMGLPGDWRSTAEGRAAAVARSLEVLRSEPNNVDATETLSSAGGSILPFTRMRQIGRDLLQASPTSVAGATLVARAAAMLGGKGEAIRLLQASLAAHPEHPSGWLRLAVCQASGASPDFAAADEALARARALSPQEADCEWARAVLMLGRDEASRALAVLDSRDVREPGVALARCDALMMLRRLGEAETMVTQELSAFPDSPYALVRLAHLRIAQNRPQEAIAAAEAAFASGGPSTDAYVVYGVARLALGQWESAERSFEYRLALTPEEPGAWVGLSVAQARRHDRSGARRSRAEALSRFPGSVAERTRALRRSLLWFRLKGLNHTASFWIVYLGAVFSTMIGAVVGLTALHDGAWLRGLLFAPVPAFVLAVLVLSGRVRPRGRLWWAGAGLAIAGVVLATGHSVAIGLGAAGWKGTWDDLIFVYMVAGSTGLALMILPWSVRRT